MHTLWRHNRSLTVIASVAWQSIVILLCIHTTAHAATMPLATAQREGLLQRPLLLAEKQTVQAHKYKEDMHRAELLPQLHLTHHSTYHKEPTTSQTTHSIALHGSQIIFEPAGPLLRTEIAQYATKRHEYRYQAATQEVRQEIATHFLKAWRLQEEKPLIEALAHYCKLLEAESTALKEGGTINSIEYAKVKASITKHRATLLSYPSEYDAARQSLAVAMGLQGEHAHAPLTYDINKALPPLRSVEYYTALAEKYRPEFSEKDMLAKEHALTAREHRLYYAPTVTMQGSVGRNFAGTLESQGMHGHIGLKLEWRFFDGMRSLKAAQAADAHALRTTLEKQELRNSVAKNITKTHAALINAQALVEATQAAAEAAILQANEVKKKKELGSAGRLEKAKACYKAQEAEYAALSARTDVHQLWNTLEWYCGYPPKGFYDE